MYRFLLSRQWVILTLVGLVLIPAMIELGFWQLHRHEKRVARNDQIAEALDARPVPAERLTSPGRDVPHSAVYRRVTAKGTYDTKHEVVVGGGRPPPPDQGVHGPTPPGRTPTPQLHVNPPAGKATPPPP
ncbi:SURF1 family cytochrome oxidase biogenesis protein, partial [Streptomyces sp. NPDC059063]|uniref:SURF1 family cytochrome oxidase biogenesis protein n=1 Tax=Streptomyces sp. NPDC059063 TaxID=3346712 RepID=UPI0036981836